MELLWTATSDDDCIMVGTNFHNNGSLYYSFMHTLPQSFLMHWECSFGLDNGTEQFDHHHAASTSLSGFTLITACRVPQGTASSRLWPGAQLRCHSSSTAGNQGRKQEHRLE